MQQKRKLDILVGGYDNTHIMSNVIGTILRGLSQLLNQLLNPYTASPFQRSPLPFRARRHRASITVALLFIATMAITSPAAEVTAIKAGRVVTVTGEIYSPGVVIIEGDKITAVGPASKVTIPAGCVEENYPKCTLYPGLINPICGLGLSGTAGTSRDQREKGEFKPHISTFTAFYPWSRLLYNAREFGILTSTVYPAGGLISGKAALVDLQGWTPKDMLVKEEVAMVITLKEARRVRRFGEAPKKPEDLDTPRKKLKKYLENAYRYHLRAANNTTQPLDIEKEAMKVLWTENLPVMIKADSTDNIRFAIKLARKYKLNAVLVNCYDGEALLKEIKESGFPVIVGSMYGRNKKWEDGVDKVFRLPAQLAAHKIPFSFSLSRAADAFDYPVQAGRAVAYGLSQEEAVKGLTIYPAQALGIQELYGSLEKGKYANIVVATGNILESSTLIKATYIKGKRIKGKSFFRDEYEKARDKVSGQ